MRRFRCAAGAVLLLLLAGCGGSGGREPATGSASAAPSCLEPAVAAAGAPASASPGAARLPDVTLPCFVGGSPVRLASLRGPAVINLWASWCAPCREELPQIERFSERAKGQVRVIGVITSDPNRPGAQSIVDDFGLRFPMLYDEKAALRAGVGGLGLPMTLVVDADGRVAHTYMARPLDEAAVAGLVERYLGVHVA
jgi:thiol-disulfide isomerase/thioredoxin